MSLPPSPLFRWESVDYSAWKTWKTERYAAVSFNDELSDRRPARHPSFARCLWSPALVLTKYTVLNIASDLKFCRGRRGHSLENSLIFPLDLLFTLFNHNGSSSEIRAKLHESAVWPVVAWLHGCMLLYYYVLLGSKVIISTEGSALSSHWC